MDPVGSTHHSYLLFMQAWIDCQPFVILALYLLPPASITLLHDAAKFAANFPSSRVICMGDFNLIHDASIDKFVPPHSGSRMHPRTQLSFFLEEMGWVDLWRFHNPNLLEYTCFTPGRNSLSRTDYICGNSYISSSCCFRSFSYIGGVIDRLYLIS